MKIEPNENKIIIKIVIFFLEMKMMKFYSLIKFIKVIFIMILII